MAIRVLVVDDEKGIADSLKTILAINGYDSRAAYSGAQALKLMARFRPHLVITDVVMPEMTGIELTASVLDRYPEANVVLLSGNAATEELLAEAGNALDSVLVLAKPYAPRDLLQVVARLTADADAA